MHSELLKDLSQVLENGQRNKAGFINPGHLAVLECATEGFPLFGKLYMLLLKPYTYDFQNYFSQIAIHVDDKTYDKQKFLTFNVWGYY